MQFACLFITHDLAVIDVLREPDRCDAPGQAGGSGDARRGSFETRRIRTPKRLLAAVPLPDPVLQRGVARDARRELLRLGSSGMGRACRVRSFPQLPTIGRILRKSLWWPPSHFSSLRLSPSPRAPARWR
jgi:hypothetical protein